MTTKPVNVGIIGCGNISGAYLKAGQTFEMLNIVACADVLLERAQAKAAEYNIPHAYTVEQLLADPSIEVVVNLTVPQAHATVARQVLEAGKSAYNEKPLALSLADGQSLVQQAHNSGLRIGCAPDTFLGGGIQTCRQLIDQGAIGTPIGATAFMLYHGPESWHPDPEFFYKPGAGPMFDMGPYYLTALVNLLGPIRRITGATRISEPARMITSQPHYGKMIQVEVPTHVVGVLDFASGPIATLITSFDVWASQLPNIEIYGTRGTLSVPDPNTFGGPVRLRESGSDTWSDIPLAYGYTTNSRSIGVADMAYALRSGRSHRASGELALHVLEAMHAIHEASDADHHITLTTTCERPAALPVGLVEGTLDA